MKVRVDVDQRVQDIMDREYRRGERAVTSGMRQGESLLKGKWREQVTSAGLGKRLANAVRGQTYPKGNVSMNASAMVWTNAPKIMAAYEHGAVIRSKDGFWLAIPTDAAGLGKRGRKITPHEWEQRTGRKLRFVFVSGRIGYLVADDVRLTKKLVAGKGRARKGRQGTSTIVIFTLLPQTRLKKRLNLLQAADLVVTQIPGLITSAWED